MGNPAKRGLHQFVLAAINVPTVWSITYTFLSPSRCPSFCIRWEKVLACLRGATAAECLLKSHLHMTQRLLNHRTSPCQPYMLVTWTRNNQELIMDNLCCLCLYKSARSKVFPLFTLQNLRFRTDIRGHTRLWLHPGPEEKAPSSRHTQVRSQDIPKSTILNGIGHIWCKPQLVDGQGDFQSLAMTFSTWRTWGSNNGLRHDGYRSVFVFLSKWPWVKHSKTLQPEERSKGDKQIMPAQFFWAPCNWGALQAVPAKGFTCHSALLLHAILVACWRWVGLAVSLAAKLEKSTANYTDTVCRVYIFCLGGPKAGKHYLLKCSDVRLFWIMIAPSTSRHCFPNGPRKPKRWEGHLYKVSLDELGHFLKVLCFVIRWK